MKKTGNVRCVVRTRPSANYAADVFQIHEDSKGITVTRRKDPLQKTQEIGQAPPPKPQTSHTQQEKWAFSFDHVLHNSTQEQVYNDCAEDIVRSALNGYNGTVICYGQTGAGKTFTMTGATENYAYRGIIPRAISQVFRTIRDTPDTAFCVYISYVEVYNENLYDLLNPYPADDTPLKIVEDASGLTHVRGLKREVVTNEEEALNFLFEGETNRTIGEHQLNKHSSRSHCIFTLYFDMRSRVESNEKVTLSKLNLVDLAGSERLTKTQPDDAIVKEAMFINKSLSFLEQVIIAIPSKKREHVPYRQSKLTNLLKDSLGGNCKTCLIANIWVEAIHFEESLATLKFATRMLQVANNAVVNVQYDPMELLKKYEKDIKDLKAELAMHDQITNRRHISYDPFTEEQQQILRNKIMQYVNSEIEELEIVNLRQIKETFMQFKSIVKSMEEQVKHAASIPQPQKHSTAPPSRGIPNSGSGFESEGVGDVEGGGFAIGLAPETNSRRVNKVVRPRQKPRSPNPQSPEPFSAEATAPSTPSASSQDPGPPPRSAPKVQSPSTSSSSRRPKSPSDQVKASDSQKDILKQKKDKKGKAEKTSKDAKASDNKHSDKEKDSEKEKGKDKEKEKEKEKPGTGKRRKRDRRPTDPDNDTTRESMPADAQSIDPESKDSDEEEPEKPVDIVKIIKPADRNQAFEMYKSELGKEASAALRHNKELLNDKKSSLKIICATLNEMKIEIDSIVTLLEKKKESRAGHAEYDGDEEIIDEEEFTSLSRLREAKKVYKENHTQYQALQSEVSYLTLVVSQCRQRLISEFEAWYDQTDESPAMAAEAEDDVLDYQEKFERMQLQAHVEKHHNNQDAKAFYSALKSAKKKKSSPSPQRRVQPTTQLGSASSVTFPSIRKSPATR